jgi:hypothetical protein
VVTKQPDSISVAAICLIGVPAHDHRHGLAVATLDILTGEILAPRVCKRR